MIKKTVIKSLESLVWYTNFFCLQKLNFNNKHIRLPEYVAEKNSQFLLNLKSSPLCNYSHTHECQISVVQSKKKKYCVFLIDH